MSVPVAGAVVSSWDIYTVWQVTLAAQLPNILSSIRRYVLPNIISELIYYLYLPITSYLYSGFCAHNYKTWLKSINLIICQGNSPFTTIHFSKLFCEILTYSVPCELKCHSLQLNHNLGFWLRWLICVGLALLIICVLSRKMIFLSNYSAHFLLKFWWLSA